MPGRSWTHSLVGGLYLFPKEPKLKSPRHGRKPECSRTSPWACPSTPPNFLFPHFPSPGQVREDGGSISFPSVAWPGAPQPSFLNQGCPYSGKACLLLYLRLARENMGAVSGTATSACPRCPGPIGASPGCHTGPVGSDSLHLIWDLCQATYRQMCRKGPGGTQGSSGGSFRMKRQ